MAGLALLLLRRRILRRLFRLIPTLSSQLTNYLTQFSLWCRNGFAAQLKNNIALPGILLQANDAPADTVPKVFLLQVDTAGAVVLTPVALGSGKP